MIKKISLASLIVLCCLLGLEARSWGLDQAMPGDRALSADPHAGLGAGSTTPTGDLKSLMPAPAIEAPDSPARKAFAANLILDKFRLLAIQHQDQVKILDSWARESLSTMRNRDSIDGQDPLYTALDMAIRPEAWQDKNFIYIRAVPVREALAALVHDAAESQRIMHEGLVSPAFLERSDTDVTLQQLGLDARRTGAVNQLRKAQYTFRYDRSDGKVMLSDSFLILPPGPGHRDDHWHHPMSLIANLPNAAAMEAEYKLPNLPVVPEYSSDQALRAQLAMQQLWTGWSTGDAAMANQGMQSFITLATSVDPAGYPSEAKRVTELWYNRTFYGTIANVFLYFLAMTMFLMVAVGVTQRLEKPALVIFTIAVALHLTSMGIRYWLAGRWPTQNQFESVLGAALLGCIIGWILEMRKKTGLFGMAFSFVGFLAMTACMAAPYMFGRDIGGAIEQTSGILQTYWLKIHVNIVISSYALIGASFFMGVLYLLTRQWYWINPIEPGFEDGGTGGGSSGSGGGSAVTTLPTAIKELAAARAQRLETLDQANMVILQMAFWFLGIGIICGAVWADQSWGRPWGWDPKETFALVTWMVYLIIVHLRFVTKARADLTAWLSVAGFGIMMFNWIGVNYFLVGLHSYA